MPRGAKVKYTDAVLNKLADSLIAWTDKCYKENKRLGMLGDWCYANGLDIRFPPLYARKHEKFGEAYKYAKGYQEHTVAEGALTKKLDGRFAQFFLGCNHGWVTKSSKDSKDAALKQFSNYFQGFTEYMKDQYEGQEVVEVNEDGELEDDLD